MPPTARRPLASEANSGKHARLIVKGKPTQSFRSQHPVVPSSFAKTGYVPPLAVLVPQTITNNSTSTTQASTNVVTKNDRGLVLPSDFDTRVATDDQINDAMFLNAEAKRGKSVIVKVLDAEKFRSRIAPEELCINLKERKVHFILTFMYQSDSTMLRSLCRSACSHPPLSFVCASSPFNILNSLISPLI